MLNILLFDFLFFEFLSFFEFFCAKNYLPLRFEDKHCFNYFGNND